MNLLSQYDTCLFTFGFGRSGSTILGQIINQHPQCLIANESRFLQSFHKQTNGQLNSKIIEQKLIEILRNNAINKWNNGLNQKELNCQKDWNNFKFTLNKDQIKVIGDKKSGGNTRLLQKDPLLIKKLLTIAPNAKFIINVRNPYTMATSLKRNIGEFNNKQISTIIEQLDEYYKICDDLVTTYPNKCLVVQYENLCNTPHIVIGQVFDFINLELSDKILNNMANVVKPTTISTTSNHTFHSELLKRYC